MNKFTLGFFLANSKTTIKGGLVLFALLLMNSQLSWGQISITGFGSGNTYNQNFDGLVNNGIANAVTTLPVGWTFIETGTSSNATYAASTGSDNGGNTYSYGATSSTDRALGGLQSGSVVPTLGVSFTNNSGSFISELVITYTGEQWRIGTANRVDRLDFQYSLNATSLSTGTWVDVDNLDFTAPVTTGSIGAKDGNAATNRTSITNTISGLSIASGATFWLRFNDFNATGADDGLAVDDFSIYANAPTATTWDGTTWSYGAPIATVDAIIDGTYNTKPVIEGGNGTFTAKKLTVNANKSFTINSGTNLTVQNDIVNSGTLTIENNANLIQVNNVANSGSGTTIVNRNSNALFRQDYTLWSSPVSGAQTLLNFSPATLATRFYTYDNTLSSGTGTGLYSAVASPSTTPFTAGTGYLIRMPNEGSTNYNAGTETLVYPGVFTGTANNGSVTIGGALDPLTPGEFYAVGNPYPSTISALAFLAGNPNADGTLYFWRKTNGTPNTTSSYATWTTVGGVAGSNVAPNNIAPDGTIAVSQGFIVNTLLVTALNFTNTMRTSSNSALFFKTKKVEDKSRIWLNLTNATGAFSQALIGYLDGATNGFDNGIDGKYINDSPIALTSSINNEEYTIQGRPNFDASDVVALNFKTNVSGDYTIAIDQVDGLFSGNQDIYLVDSKTGTETNLKAGAYNFTAAAEVDNTRFSLKFQKTLSVNAQTIADNSVIVYKNNGGIYVNSGAKTMNNIKVFDIQGRLVAERNNMKSNTCSIQNLKASNQILIVKVTTEDNLEISKKVEN
ncbi:T9SS sorting signal type C domain-containing protein [Flavobacterium nackdongense]|uniref:T9SS sorting signal type C domain-containing protein n=1 Tax=Flavobacterium nackdongense TaxID=2547394 RepID=A0A4P6YGS2_9FLAO|nr:T9SS sorting signal type C domain-containing protein [Flavobacterium nackdongense]QBN20017.1 T9SS sorting signal type C domain-containing protein [Flavobacterium nackdongense]